MAGPSSFTFPLSEAQARRLEQRLHDGTFETHDVAYARAAGSKPGLAVVLYAKGPKVVVQGKQAEEFVRFVLEPEILGAARLGYEEVTDPEQFAPHFGIDESGKGDFFGPLVIAGVYTDGAVTRALLQAGVTGATPEGLPIAFTDALLTMKALSPPAWEALLPDPLVRHTGPSTLLAALNEQAAQSRYVLHLLHYIPERRGTSFDTIEDVIPLYDVAVSLRCSQPVTGVTLVPDGAALPWQVENGRVSFRLPKIAGHQMVEIARG